MRITFSGNSSVGRARPCQGRGREFESCFPLQFETLICNVRRDSKAVCTGLQIHVARFDSGSRLQYFDRSPPTIKIIKCPGGEIGRHKGFKIPRLMGVPVRFWPGAPFLLSQTFLLVPFLSKSTT